MKSIRKAVTFLSLAFSAALFSEEIILVDGSVLADAKVIDSDAVSVIIVHSGGVATVPFENCPLDIQALRGYSRKRAAEFLAQRKEDEIRAKAEREAAREKREAELLATESSAVRNAESMLALRKVIWEVRKSRLVGEVISVSESGLLLSLNRDPVFTTRTMYPPKMPTRPDATPLMMSEVSAYKEAAAAWEEHLLRCHAEIEKSELVLLKGHPSHGSLVDGSLLDVYATRDGTYRYDSVGGSSNTVYQFNYYSETPFTPVFGFE